MQLDSYCAPVVVGGVGGSGTRLVAQCLEALGFYLGQDLNQSYDNLWFTLLFKRPETLSASPADLDHLLALFLRAMTGSPAFSPEEISQIQQLADEDRLFHPRAWLQRRARSMLAPAHQLGPAEPWAWKEPTCHLILDRLQDVLPTMKYIHVARNGLDMAYSANQSQLHLWGAHFLGNDYALTPRHALRYWTAVHRRVLRMGRPMASRFWLLNFDQLCAAPETGIQALLDFLGIALPAPQRARLARLVQPPTSLHRYKKHGLNAFDDEDVAFVRHLGFETSLD